MKKILIALSGILILIVVSFVIVSIRFHAISGRIFPHPQFAISEEVARADIQLGKRLYNVRNACIECHGADLSGVKSMDNGAMGSIYGANISPYKMKDWTDEQIAAAIRYGIHKEGRSLRFMPSFDFAHLGKTDVASIIAYIRSMPSIEKESHENSFGPVAMVLSVLDKMPVMFPAYHIEQSLGFGDKPPEGATREFGSYLAKDCRGCHGMEYRGGRIPGGDPSWPPAPSIRLGSDKTWNESNFKETLATGVSSKTGKAIRPPMPIEVLKQLNETEVKALWLYLSELK